MTDATWTGDISHVPTSAARTHPRRQRLPPTPPSFRESVRRSSTESHLVRMDFSVPPRRPYEHACAASSSLPNVKDEPRPWPARLLQGSIDESAASFDWT